MFKQQTRTNMNKREHHFNSREQISEICDKVLPSHKRKNVFLTLRPLEVHRKVSSLLKLKFRISNSYHNLEILNKILF